MGGVALSEWFAGWNSTGEHERALLYRSRTRRISTFMQLVFLVSPVLVRWLPTEHFDDAIVLFDLEPDITNHGRLRLDLEVIVNRFHLRTRVGAEREEWYLGCTGVRVEIVIPDAHVCDWTPELDLPTEYENSTKRIRTSTAKLVAHQPGASVEMALGGIELTANQERTFTTKYSGRERVIQVTEFGRKIRWELILPRGEKAVQDFVVANLHFHSEWTLVPKLEGEIRIIPTTVQWFNHERRMLGRFQKHVADFFLWQERPRTAKNLDGISGKFLLTALDE